MTVTPDSMPAAAPDGATAPGLTRTVMRMAWRDLTYLHWPVAPRDVARLLPAGLVPDLHDGVGWVGLVPFEMRGIGAPIGPAVPWLGSFAETNVRTYVRGPDGQPGVYFHSLDVPRAAPVLVARLAYRLPYCWASMRIDRDPPRLRYRAERRWPAVADGTSQVEIRVGQRILRPTPLDDFLVNRFTLFADGPGGLARADVRHAPWSLHEAVVDHLDDALVAAAGYEVDGPPAHVRATPGVDVAVGPPSRVGG